MLRTRWLQKPPNGVRVNLGSPITQGLKAAWLFNESGGDTTVEALQGTRGLFSGASWGANRIIHDATSDKVTLAADSTQVLKSAAGFSYILGYRKRDSTTRNSVPLGIDRATSNTPGHCHMHLPFNDGNIYFDYGGVVNGTTRVQVSASGISFQNDSVWAFTTGARGMEIWQDGRKIVSNTANPTRSADANPFALGRAPGNTQSDLADYLFLYIYWRQLGLVEIEQLSRHPYSICQVRPIALQAAGIQFPTDLIDVSDAASVVASEATPTLNTIDVIDVADALSLVLSDTASLTQETNALDVSDSIAMGIADLAALLDAFVLSVSDTTGLGLSEDIPQEWFTENPALLTLVWQEYIKSAGGASDALIILWNEQRDSEDILIFQWVEFSQEIDTLTLLWRELPPVYTLHTAASRILFPSRRLLVT